MGFPSSGGGSPTSIADQFTAAQSTGMPMSAFSGSTSTPTAGSSPPWLQKMPQLLQQGGQGISGMGGGGQQGGGGGKGFQEIGSGIQSLGALASIAALLAL